MKPVYCDLCSAEMELVEQQKQEFRLLGSYLRTPGLTLFCYNPHKDTLEKAEIVKSNLCVLVPNKFDPKGYEVQPYEPERIEVNPNWEYFEAVSLKSATKKVQRYKEGKISTLWNLRVPSQLKSIKPF